MKQSTQTENPAAPLQLTWPYADWCIYCGQDAETCEHYDPVEEAERNQ